MAGIRKVDYLISQKGTPQVFLDGHLYNRNAVCKTAKILRERGQRQMMAVLF